LRVSDVECDGSVGLRLYIVKTFTEMLGGHVRSRSELSRGTTFRVTLPGENQHPLIPFFHYCPSTFLTRAIT
jgi:signal transduction histidine kinase